MKELPLEEVSDRSDSTVATLLIDCHNELGEGVLYDDVNQAVLWTDINGRRFHYLCLKSGELLVYSLPKMLCSFGMIHDYHPLDALFCAWEDGFQIYRMRDNEQIANELSPCSVGPDVNPTKLPTRLNDGRVDPTGTRFVCGGFYGDIPGKTMSVFAVEQEQQEPWTLRHRTIVPSIQVTNSITWSPSGQSMYLADSPTHSIFRFDCC
jgi:L-arabinonolactonase